MSCALPDPTGRCLARCVRRAAAQGLCAAFEGQAGALPRESQWQASGLQRAHSHQPRPQPGHRPGVGLAPSTPVQDI